MDMHPETRGDSDWRTPGEPAPDDRDSTEHFIAACYRDRFGATLRRFMPQLIEFRDGRGALRAAAGLRFGSDGPLFCERYLDAPMQDAVAQHVGVTVPRETIVEVGNFAAADPGDARRTIVQLTPWLHRRGARWVVFVATRQLRNTFARLGLAPLALGQATLDRVAGDGNDWGRYYDHAPEVLLGDLAGGVAFLEHLQRDPGENLRTRMVSAGSGA